MGLRDAVDGLTERPLVRQLLAAVVGALLGMVVSFTVNCTLVEISINAFFAFYFGVLFVLIGGLIIWRVRGGEHPNPTLLLVFSSMVLVSGFLCFFLEQNWFLRTHAGWKVPMYGVLGMSVCFGFLFPLIDLINFFCSSGSGPSARPLIESERQVYLVVAAAVTMGVVFGLIFGLLDVEDARTPVMLKLQLMRAESICYPIGALLGGLAAAANQRLRDEHADALYDHIHDDELDDDDY